MTVPRPEAFFFGPRERPLFGWLHRPAERSAPGVGLVICNPFGYEAVCAHRSLRHFAMAAAEAGIPALRFDYDGTGDSAGDDFDENRLDAWLGSLQQAADSLKEITGVGQICLLGVRLGATLATLAAARRSDVAALIAVAPVVTAKAYVRELRALALVTQEKGPAEESDDGTLESAGFLLTAHTQNALKTIDLNRSTDRPCSRVMILDRDDLPANESWVQTLRNNGAEVEHQSVAGYVEMMLDAHETVVPEEMIRIALGWLSGVAGTHGTASAPATTSSLIPPNPQTHMSRQGPARNAVIEETAVFFGGQSLSSGTALFGIVSRPMPVNPGAKAPSTGVLLLNSGGVQHIGPNRLYVTLARRWAALGHTVLRLDLSGIGDSPVRPGEAENVVYPAHANEEIRAALDYLQKEFRVRETYALGLCSGAYHGLKAAVAQAPLTGVVLINPLTFFWKEGMSLQYPAHRVAADIVRYRTNAFRKESWQKLLSGGVDLGQLAQVLLRRLGSSILNSLRDMARRLKLPLAEDLGTELENLAKEPVDMLFVFAANDPGIELLRTQGGSVVPRLLAKGKMDIHIIDGADHTFTYRVTRRRLIEVLAHKLDRLTVKDA